MSQECPKCKEKGKVGIISCDGRYDKNSDCWIAMCGNEDCDYVLPHRRTRNIPVEKDRRNGNK